MFKINEFCTLCFQIIHVLSFKLNPVSFSVKFGHVLCIREHFCQFIFAGTNCVDNINPNSLSQTLSLTVIQSVTSCQMIV
ncbi:hypothetical protein Hanom_Chr05g00468551 [Helianthus anomalus]